MTTLNLNYTIFERITKFINTLNLNDIFCVEVARIMIKISLGLTNKYFWHFWKEQNSWFGIFAHDNILNV